MSQVDENGIVVVPTIISGVSGSLAFMPADISTSSYALTGSDLEDFIRETASFTLDANNNELKITIPATHSNLTEDVIPLYITASGINPRVGVGVTSPLTTFDFKDVEDATTGTELLLRNSRTSEGAQVGDSAGKLFFTIDSSSFTDVKTEGAIATIETQVDSVDYTGVTGELIFSVAQGKSVAPVNKLKINPTLTQITGSLDVTTDVSGSGLYFSSSGQSFINRLAIGSNTTLTGFQRLYVAGDSLFHGDVELGNQASDIINIHGIVEITGSVTSSADISSSGEVIALSSSIDYLAVNDQLQGNGAGFQFFAFNEDTVKLKFVNWYTSNDNQYGMGMLWYETWFGAIDTDGNANDTHRRIGFYLEQPNSGSTDSPSGVTGTHPTNARFYVDVTGSYVASGGLHVTDADFNVESNGNVEVNGNITSSGVISSSGTDDSNFGGRIVQDNNKFLAGTETGGTTRNILGINNSDVTQVANANIATNIKGTSITLASSVTASGNISSSGAVTASGIVSSGDIHLSTNNTQITQVLSAGATRDLIGFDGDNNAVVGNSTSNKIKLVGDVTASANISASGDLFVRSRTIAYSTATDAYSGDVVSFGSGPSGNDGNINAGELYYLDSSQNWEVADADAASTATNMLGIAVADNTATFLVKGIIKNTAYAGFTTGVPLYVSTTAGDITSTAPSGTGDIVRVVGYSVNGGSRIIYFNPSNDHIVHA